MAEAFDINERAEEVRVGTTNLGTDIGKLASALDEALADMESLRQRATALQRELMAMNSRDPDAVPLVLELGRLMRHIQESGRLLETVGEPLRLTSQGIANKLSDIEQRITAAIQKGLA